MREMLWATMSAETRLLLEAEDVAGSGDTELAATYQAYPDATQHLLDTRGVWERTRAIPDVSIFECNLALSLELLAYAQANVAQNRVLATLARRHRLEALQQRSQEQPHDSQPPADGNGGGA